ncbi:MAG: HEAT repeat domain-containing protein [Candidatus Riflebacteria bacterium]|nr:HEAT repeat domain-containing protein [Candidatus Riflebacteria bacterium]
MNNLDIDTILIVLVVVLVIVVIARIAIQRYKMSHIKLPENVREAGSKAADSAISKKSQQKVVSISEDKSSKEEVVKEAVPAEEEKIEVKEEKPEEPEEPEKTEKEDSKDEKSSNTDKKESEYELDYQQLISDPVGILTNTKLPARHRIAAIREIGYQKLESAVPELIKALYDPDTSISLVAAECLGALGDSRAIEPLLDISKQNDEELCKAAEEYLGGALVISGDQPQTNTNSQQNEENAPRNYKEMVVFKVEQLPLDYFQPDGSPIPRKELVLKGLNDNNEQMRQMAAKAAIGIEESEEIIDPLSKALNNPLESEAIRAMAAEALGGMDSDKSVTALIKALKDENVAVRYASATALSGRSEPRVVEALIGATRDSDKYVRASAAYALGTTGATVALKALIKCAEDENDAVRFSAVKAISGYDFKEVIKRLGEPKSSSESKSQILAKIEILSQFKEPKAIEILKEYLEDSDSEICYKASMALMGQENPELIEELIEASRRLDKELYRLAKENIAPDVFSEITKFNSDFNLGNDSLEKNDKPKVTTVQNDSGLANGVVPPSRRETIQDTADFVKAKNLRKEEAVLNINPDDYSGEIFFKSTDDNYEDNSRKDNNRGFNNENLDEMNKRKEEIVVELDDYQNQQPLTEEIIDEQTYFNDSSSVFGNQPSFDDAEIVAEPVEQNYFDDIVDNEDLPLEQMTGLPNEFEKIRIKLLDESPNIRGKAANTLGNYVNSRESIMLLKGALKDENELVRVAAIKSLGKIANLEALQLILSCERDMSTEVRYAVVKALAEIPDYSAAEALKRMASNDISIDVKRNARIALEKHS